MTVILHDMMHIYMEVYIDDVLVNSKTHEDHSEILKKVLQHSKEFKLRMNLKKCVFRVSSGELLEFMMSQQGIEVDHSKIKAILEMLPLSNIK